MIITRGLEGLLLSVVMLLCFSVASLCAEEQKVYQDQYILRRLASSVKQDRLMDFIEGTRREDYVVAHSMRKALLVRTDDEESTALGDVVPKDQEKFCVTARRALRDAKKKKTRKIPSRIVCTPNYEVGLVKSANDTYLSIQYALESMKVPQAWDISTGLERLSVSAVVDTGIDLNHPDLFNRLFVNTGEIPDNGVDDDGNGYIDDVHGYNFHDGNGNPQDGHGHGTHVAGVIGAQTNNSLGIAGINWSTKLIAVKVLGNDGRGSMYSVLQGIGYINDLSQSGVPIHSSNYSLAGGPYYSSYVSEIMRARNNNIMFVAAAGNASSNNDQYAVYPASYQVDNVISVAAIDSSDSLASFSNYGASTVHIGAPGVDIASTYKDNRYVYMSGTSMAAPQVAGVVSLAHAYSGADYKTIRDALFATGTAVSALSGRTITGKKPNVFKLLQQLEADAGPNPTPTPDPDPSPPEDGQDYLMLYDAIVGNGNITIEYYKNFATCAHIYKVGPNSKQKVQQGANFLCVEDSRTTVTHSMNEFVIPLVAGDEIVICHGNNGNICSPLKVVRANPNPTPTATPTPTPTPTPEPSPFPIVSIVTAVNAVTQEAIPGAKIQLIDYYNSQTLLGEATTSGTATAEFNLTGPVRMILRASKDGYNDLVAEDDNLIWEEASEPGTKKYTAKLRPKIHKVTGAVVDEANDELNGAVVIVNTPDVISGRKIVALDGDGRFEINLYHGTNYSLTVRRDGYALDYEVDGKVLGDHERLLVLRDTQD